MALSSEQRDWLTLTLVPGVGTTAFIQLLARFRTPGNVLRASQGELEDVVGRKLAGRIVQYTDVADTAGQEAAITKHGVQVITLEDPMYPLRLAEIYDPPLLLFVRGDIRPEDDRCVAIVGTRRASSYGLRAAEAFARDLASRGVTVVSGMASGIDAAAHRGAIDGGGRTIAVLGNGVDVTYPRQHEELMQDIIRHGCVMSQFAMGVEPSPGHFPYRNRIISGMSMGTLIVEAPERSGALITARRAAEQGREVFAVPGAIGSVNSLGPHRLIQEGAKLVQHVDDILVELDLASDAPETRTPPAPLEHHMTRRDAVPPEATGRADDPGQSRGPSPVPANLSHQEEAVLSSLNPDGSYVDEIAGACRIAISEALSALTHLELKGLVRQFSGKRFARR